LIILTSFWLLLARANGGHFYALSITAQEKSSTKNKTALSTVTHLAAEPLECAGGQQGARPQQQGKVRVRDGISSALFSNSSPQKRVAAQSPQHL
jgi:hypothetical protein